MKQTDKKWAVGFSPAAFAAGLFAMLLMAVIIQYAEVLIGIAFPAEHAIPLPAVWVIVLLSFLVGGFFLITRIRLLTRAEMLCVAYALLIAAPLMTQGFWHRIVAITATNPRAGDFEKMDAFNDNLWPHGPNLVESALGRSKESSLTFAGGHAWEPVEYDAGKTADLPVLRNTRVGESSTIRVRLEPDQPDKPGVVGGEPYIISVSLRPSDLAPEASYFGRLYFDDKSGYAEIFNSAAPSKQTFIHQTAFMRVGAYGVRVPASARGPFVLELGLSGPGKLELNDLKMLNVAALEGVYKGKLIVTESQLASIPPSERAGLIVRPDTLWSVAGVKFVLAGYIPVRDWAMPMLAWTSVMLIILTGTLSVAIIMRKQWMENERFSLPLTRVPLALVDDDGGALPPIWRNKLMWAGFILAAVWVLMKAAAFYNPRVPDPTISIMLKPYFSDPKWGTMFNNVRFEVVGVFLALCVFMELNVLLSLVVGYWLFRSQGWLGEFTRWNTDPNYPFTFQQTTASYVAYGLVTLFFTRRYLGFVIRAALRGDPGDGQAMSYRGAVVLLLFTIAACAAWARWMGIGVPGMLLFFLFLLLVGFVAARFRTECGLAWGYFGPQNLALFMIIMGGVSVFGPSTMLFFYVISFMLAPTVFFLIPGAQLELVELGQRWSVRPRHLLWASVLGAVGGMVIGGWVFLSNSYALGGETTRYSWAYDTKPWYFFSYNQEMGSATNQFLGKSGGEAVHGIDPQWYGVAYAAGGTILVTVMRQLFAGFWFHPIGFVLGSTNFMDYIWGSALTAWAVRGTVLKLGGGAAVKNKLQPFFIGFFLGAAFAELLIGIHGVHLRSIGIEQIYPVLIPA